MKLALRSAIAILAVAGVVSAGTAGADASGAACALFTDPAGDAGITSAVAGGPNDDALDFTYVNLASDKTKLTGVLGMSKAAAEAATAPNGFRMLLNFTVPGHTNVVYLNATGASRTGVSFSFGENDTSPGGGLTTLGPAAGVLDTKKNEIRITAKLSDLKAAGVKLATGDTLTAINAASSRDFVAVITYADKASGDKEYVVGSKSCVAVGK